MLNQSAVEYLMTYGWSILIVAVILGALAYLGAFNPLYFAPKANPGSCQVFRPNGAGTSYDINLLGVCNGEIPEYTGDFDGIGSVFSGPGSYVNVINSNSLNVKYITMAAWINLPSYNCGSDRGIIFNKENSYEWGIRCNSGNLDAAISPNWAWYGTYQQIPLNKWTFVAVTWNGVSQNYYIDGEESISYTLTPGQIQSSSGCLRIGARWCPSPPGSFFLGQMSNVQIYNTSLDQNSIIALYQEGIGGAPIDLQNLVGWWPLNGDANDYSGNGNNGVPTNVVYTSSWISGYNPP